jgi:hypothetical protein
MEPSEYDIWAMRINEAIRVNAHGTHGDKSTGPLSIRDLLLVFGEEASSIAGAIGRNIEAVQILGADRQGMLEGFLDEMMKFPEFSYLEYRYHIPSKKQPGIRFLVILGDKAARILVHYFEDLVFWKVDPEGRRIYRQPIEFDIHHGTITASPHPDTANIYSGCSSWQMALRETLALPFRYLYTTSYP